MWPQSGMNNTKKYEGYWAHFSGTLGDVSCRSVTWVLDSETGCIST